MGPSSERRHSEAQEIIRELIALWNAVNALTSTNFWQILRNPYTCVWTVSRYMSEKNSDEKMFETVMRVRKIWERKKGNTISTYFAAWNKDLPWRGTLYYTLCCSRATREQTLRRSRADSAHTKEVRAKL